jgi:hypothetical protein
MDELAALRAIAEGTAPHTGQEFFQSLVRHLAPAVGARYAFVAVFAGGTRARTLAFWSRDRITDNIEWDVIGTPCEDVMRGNLCHHPAGVSQRFPENKLIVRLQRVPACPRHVEGGLRGSRLHLTASSRHSLAQSRHEAAQAAMCLSSGNFPQAAAHSSQHFAQHSSMGRARGLWRAHRVEQVLQHSGQSAQSCAVLAWSFWPSASSARQWVKHESHWS